MDHRKNHSAPLTAFVDKTIPVIVVEVSTVEEGISALVVERVLVATVLVVVVETEGVTLEVVVVGIVIVVVVAFVVVVRAVVGAVVDVVELIVLFWLVTLVTEKCNSLKVSNKVQRIYSLICKYLIHIVHMHIYIYIFRYLNLNNSCAN